ncbi:MAG: hypothetical protein AMXMBFR77_27890 [Phycisphaerales bacterium]
MWSAKNFEGAGEGFLDRVNGWFDPRTRKAKELALNDLVDIIHRVRPATVAIKAFDGRAPMNQQLLDAVVPELKALGIGLWLWAYQYPWNPSDKKTTSPTDTQCVAYVRQEGELLAREAVRRGAIGACSNLEKEWQPGWRGLTRARLHTISAALLRSQRVDNGLRTAVSSYAEPSAFPTMPWSTWCQGADEQWPQLYSKGQSGDYGVRAGRILEQFSALQADKVVWSGPLYRGAHHMRDMFAAVSPLLGRPGEPTRSAVGSVVFWWAADQMTEDREAVLLTRRTA